MLTRSRSRLSKMESSVGSVSDSVESVEVNNQLGLNNIYDDVTMNNVIENRTEAGGHMVENTQTTDINTDIIQRLQQIAEQINQKIDETQRQFNQKLDETLRQNNQKIREELRQLAQDVKRDNQELLATIRNETREMVKDEIQILKTNTEEQVTRLDNTIQQNHLSITQDIENINKRITTNNKKQEELMNSQRQENENSIKAVREECKEKISEIEKVVVNNNEQMDGRFKQINNELKKIEQTVPTTRGIANEVYKNVIFNGEGEYPMEFLKELQEIHKECYHQGNVAWIIRHLEGEAAIWWKLVRDSVTNFKEFEDAFIAKYWNALIQEGVRDRLEFGRYRWEDGLSMTQYMERRVLENRQLIPKMADQHLIRKLARHYNHNIEVAIITRGVSTIQEFQQVLYEFSNMRQNTNRNMQLSEQVKREPLTVTHEQRMSAEGNVYNRRQQPQVKYPVNNKADAHNHKEKRVKVYESQIQAIAGPSNINNNSNEKINSVTHPKNGAAN